MLVITVKSEPTFEYQVARLLVTEPSHASLKLMLMTPYKLEMALQTSSPVNRSLRRKEDDDDGF
jgi:hypothetical protein